MLVPEQTEKIDASSNAIGDEQAIDPALMWGLIGAGICLCLLLIIICVSVLVVRRRRLHRRDYPSATDMSDFSSERDSKAADDYLQDGTMDDGKDDAIAQPSPPPSAPPSDVIYSSFKAAGVSPDDEQVTK
jgi:hypothetical protein